MVARMNEINTNINIIGGIPDYDIIYDVLRLMAEKVSTEDIYQSVIINNKYGIRTEGSRDRFLSVIKSAFWQFKNGDHEMLIRSLFKSDSFEKTKNFALFWMMGINNILFENITKQVFAKFYFSGRVQIRNDDIIAYLRHERETSAVIRKWSDTTINTVASKYLTFLKKIGFLKGRQKKAFKYIQFDNSSLIYFLYLIKAVEPEQPNILKSRYMDFFFIEKSSFISIIKKAVFADFFSIQTTGSDLEINLKYDFGEVTDAISRRS